MIFIYKALYFTKPDVTNIPVPDKVLCDICGIEYSKDDMSVRYFNRTSSSWRGTCVICSRQMNAKRLREHTCAKKDINTYGCCTVCGTVQPYSILDKYHRKLTKLDKEFGVE